MPYTISIHYLEYALLAILTYCDLLAQRCKVGWKLFEELPKERGTVLKF